MTCSATKEMSMNWFNLVSFIGKNTWFRSSFTFLTLYSIYQESRSYGC
jgi:hypothetical protein